MVVLTERKKKGKKIWGKKMKTMPLAQVWGLYAFSDFFAPVFFALILSKLRTLNRSLILLVVGTLIIGGATADEKEKDNPYFLPATSPLRGETYAPTSDIVVTGMRGDTAEHIVVSMHGPDKITYQTGIAEPKAGSKRWFRDLPNEQVWPPGNYRIEIRGIKRGTSSYSITIFDDGGPINRKRAITRDIRKMAREPDEPTIALPAMQLPNPEADPADDDDVSDAAAAKHKARPPVTITKGQPFTVEGSIKLEAKIDPEEGLFPVVLRLIDEKTTVIAQEAAAALGKQAGVYRQRMLAPDAPGRYRLEALYRRHVLGSVPFKVRAKEEE
jgi:hypothetical protein